MLVRHHSILFAVLLLAVPFVCVSPSPSVAAPSVELKANGSIAIGNSRRLILDDSGVINISCDNGDTYEAFIPLTRVADGKWFGTMHLDNRHVTVDQAQKTTTFRGTFTAPGQPQPIPLEISAAAQEVGKVRIAVRYLTNVPISQILSSAYIQFQSPRSQHRGENVMVGAQKITLATDEPNSANSKPLYRGVELPNLTYFPGHSDRQISVLPVQATSEDIQDNNRPSQATIFTRLQPKDNAIIFDLAFEGQDKAVSPETYGGIDFWAANRFRLPRYGVSRNLVQNSGFESNFHGWRFGRRGQVDATPQNDAYQIDESDPYSGKRCLKILGKNGQSPAHLNSFAIPLETGGTYTLSFYARADQDLVPLGLSCTTATWPTFVSHNFNLTREWKRYEFSFQAPNEALALDFGLDRPDRDCVVWLDNVQLEKGPLTDYVSKPVGAAVWTDGRGNWTQPGSKVGARLELDGKSGTSGTASLKVTDFFGNVVHEENLPFQLDTTGGAKLAFPWAEKLSPGLYLFETDLKAGDFTDRDFSRVTIAPFGTGTEPHQGLFAYGAETWNLGSWERRLDFFKRAGMGSAIYFDPGPQSFMQQVARSGIVNVSSIFDAGDKVDKRNLKENYHCTEADLQLIETRAFEKATAHPEVTYWKLVNEPGTKMSINIDEMKEFVKPLLAARKGILRANPKAKVLSPDPSNMAPQSGIQWIDLFLDAGGLAACDIIAIHPYRPRPEEPDMDDDLATFIKMLDRHGYKGDIWFTEGMGNIALNLPEAGVDVYKALSQEGRSGGWRVGPLSYDLGWGEKIAAAYAMRSWLVGLKYGDRIKQQVNWYYFYNSTLDYDQTPGAEVFASNTLSQLLGNSSFKQNIELGEGLRGYLFEDGTKRPVAALWSTDIRVDKGEAEGPLIDISSLPPGIEIIDFTGAPVARLKELRVNSFPVFIRGAVGTGGPFATALASLPLNSSMGRQLLPFVKVIGVASAEMRLQNLFSRPAQGRLQISQDGKSLYDTDITVAGKAAWRGTLAWKSVTGQLTPQKFQVIFKPKDSSRTQVSEVSLETLSIPRLAKPPIIDGNLADWPATSVLPLPRRLIDFNKNAPYGGSTDLSGTFYSGWDAENLYLAFDVKDDQLIPGPRSNAVWQGDGVQIYFDSFQNAGAATKPSFDSDDQNFDLWPSPDGLQVRRVVTPDIQLAFLKPGLVESAKTAFKRTKDGYIMELAIPKAELAPIDFKAGGSFGFSFILNDKDDETSRRKRGLTLTPEGTEPFNHPELFTTVVLQP